MITLKKQEACIKKKLKFAIFTFVFLVTFGCVRNIPEFRNEKKIINVAQGTEFKVLFNEEHSKGQTWSLVYEFDFSKLEYIRSNYRGPSSGVTEFIFQAKEKGEVEVKFNLVEYSKVIKQSIVKIKIE